MSAFKITAEMLNGYCQRGLTVKEMAGAISVLSGIKCSVNTVKEACEHYKISLKAKPRKSAFVFDTVEVENPIAENTVGELEMV